VSTFFIHVMEKVDTIARARPLEVLEAGSQSVKLRIDGLRVPAGCRVAPQRLADERQRRRRAAELVLRAGDQLGIRAAGSLRLAGARGSRARHTASVSL
jgi:hypothetical protein